LKSFAWIGRNVAVEEGQHLVSAVRDTGGILQTGSQQRSDKNFRLACELERSGPVSIEAKPLVEMIPDGFSALSEYAVNYSYANGVTHSCHSTAANEWNGAVSDPKGQQHGVKFEGTDGWIWVTRGSIEASNPESLTTPLAADSIRLYESNDHMGNFFDCIRTRKAPICEAEIGHRSASLCHLGVLSLRLGRKLQWNPETEQFVGDDDANRWLRRELRKPWSYDAVCGDK